MAAGGSSWLRRPHRGAGSSTPQPRVDDNADDADGKPKLSEALGLLRAAPDDQFAKMIGVIEGHRASPFAAAIIERNRERLGVVRPPRVMTPQRLFCRPFEDVLDTNSIPGAGGLSRAAMTRCWSLIETRLGADAVAAVQADIAATRPGDDDALYVIGRNWWAKCAAALAAAIDTAGPEHDRGTEAEPMSQSFEARLIVEACRAGPAIERVKNYLPERPTAALPPAARHLVRAEIERIADARIADPRVVVHVIAHRLANPAELFGATDDIAFGPASAVGRALLGARERIAIAGAAATRLRLDRLLAKGFNREAVELLDSSVDSLSTVLDRAEARHDVMLSDDASRLRLDLADLLRQRLIPAVLQVLSGLRRDLSAQRPLPPAAVSDFVEAVRVLATVPRPAHKLGIAALLAGDIAPTVDAVERSAAATLARLGLPTPKNDYDLPLPNATALIEHLAAPPP